VVSLAINTLIKRKIVKIQISGNLYEGEELHPIYNLTEMILGYNNSWNTI